MSISVASGGPVLFVQQFINDRLQLVVVLGQEAGIEITVCKPHCHKPLHWGLWGRWSLPLARDPLGDVRVVHPLGRILSWRGRGEQRVKCHNQIYLQLNPIDKAISRAKDESRETCLKYTGPLQRDDLLFFFFAKYPVLLYLGYEAQAVNSK